MTSDARSRFVSRGGEKLDFALAQFGFEVSGLCCADLGSHVGGFVDCLLQRGAVRVYSIDTSYGTLAWKLRKNKCVVVMERTNAMHASLPESVGLVTIDTGWTRQEKVLPNARKMLAVDGSIITLIKPHYEAAKAELDGGVLPAGLIDSTIDRVCEAIIALGFTIEATCESPIKGHGGNREFLALLSRGGS